MSTQQTCGTTYPLPWLRKKRVSERASCIACGVLGAAIAVGVIGVASIFYPIELRGQDINIGRHLCDKNEGVQSVRIRDYFLPNITESREQLFTFRCKNSAQFVDISITINPPEVPSIATIQTSNVIR